MNPDSGCYVNSNLCPKLSCHSTARKHRFLARQLSARHGRHSEQEKRAFCFSQQRRQNCPGLGRRCKNHRGSRWWSLRQGPGLLMAAQGALLVWVKFACGKSPKDQELKQDKSLFLSHIQEVQGCPPRASGVAQRRAQGPLSHCSAGQGFPRQVPHGYWHSPITCTHIAGDWG